MTMDTLKATLVDELFVKGRIWDVGPSLEEGAPVSQETPGVAAQKAELLKIGIGAATKGIPYGDAISYVSSEVIDRALATDPQIFTSEGEGGISLPIFSSRMGREVGAMSGVMLEAAGVEGVPAEFAEEVINGLFEGRYNDIASEDWRLWTDKALRNDMVATFLGGHANGQLAANVAGLLLDMTKEASAPTPKVEALPSVDLPTAETLDVPSATSAPSNIGSLGSIGFEVSLSEIFTLSELSRRREAGFAEHKVVNGKARLQFTGIGLWEIKVRVVLSRNWTAPEKRIEQITEVQTSGEHNPLVVGGRNFGQFVIVSYSEDVKSFGRNGEIERAEIDLALREYSDEGAGITQISRRRTPAAAPVRKSAPVKKLSTFGPNGGL